MNKLTEFLTEGTVTLKKVNSSINGELTVKWDSFAGYQIMGGGLWQVGGPVEDVWREAIKNINSEEISRILILGLGGGTIANLARKKWPNTKITGVDIDPVIVKLGKDYLGLDKQDVDIHIDEADLFIKSKKLKEKYDLVCVDLYVGDNYPEKFETEEFIKNLQRVIKKEGTLAVNRLYYGKKTKLAEKFLTLLKKNFSEVKEIYPKVAENVVYIAT